MNRYSKTFKLRATDVSSGVVGGILKPALSRSYCTFAFKGPPRRVVILALQCLGELCVRECVAMCRGKTYRSTVTWHGSATTRNIVCACKNYNYCSSNMKLFIRIEALLINDFFVGKFSKASRNVYYLERTNFRDLLKLGVHIGGHCLS